jgi:hypothetical protein
MAAFLGMGDGQPAVYELVRTGVGRYRLLRQFRYVEDGEGGRAFTVPGDLASFETDLASIPVFATWLVPKDGRHTPAALLHDALVRDREGRRTVVGPLVDGHEADRIFRDAMGELQVPLLRRWMMWAAVSLKTLFERGPLVRRAWFWVVVPLTVVVGVVFGLLTAGDVLHGNQAWRPSWAGGRFLAADLRWVALAVPLAWLLRLGIGLLTTAVLVVFAFPLTLAAVGFAAYYAAELAAFVALVVWRHLPVPGKPGNVAFPGILSRRAGL